MEHRAQRPGPDPTGDLHRPCQGHRSPFTCGRAVADPCGTFSVLLHASPTGWCVLPVGVLGDRGRVTLHAYAKGRTTKGRGRGGCGVCRDPSTLLSSPACIAVCSRCLALLALSGLRLEAGFVLTEMERVLSPQHPPRQVVAPGPFQRLIVLPPLAGPARPVLCIRPPLPSTFPLCLVPLFFFNRGVIDTHCIHFRCITLNICRYFKMVSTIGLVNIPHLTFLELFFS